MSSRHASNGSLSKRISNPNFLIKAKGERLPQSAVKCKAILKRTVSLETNYFCFYFGAFTFGEIGQFSPKLGAISLMAVDTRQWCSPFDSGLLSWRSLFASGIREHQNTGEHQRENTRIRDETEIILPLSQNHYQNWQTIKHTGRPRDDFRVRTRLLRTFEPCTNELKLPQWRSSDWKGNNIPGIFFLGIKTKRAHVSTELAGESPVVIFQWKTFSDKQQESTCRRFRQKKYTMFNEIHSVHCTVLTHRSVWSWCTTGCLRCRTIMLEHHW